MDCEAVVLEIADYFSRGYLSQGISFFNRSFDPLKRSLRKKYFERYRGILKENEEDSIAPRTGHFISAVYVEILKDISEDKDLKVSISNGLTDRVFNNLRERGYGDLIYDNREE